MSDVPFGRLYTSFDSAVRRPRLSRLFQRWVLGTKPLARMYWRFAPQFHRTRRHLMPGYVDSSIDPFELTFVNPGRITRFSHRAYPIWRDRWQLFGAIVDGEWDRRDTPPVRQYEGLDLSLYLADQFTETPLHRGLRAHFEEGTPWKETTFIQEVMQSARDETVDGPVWHQCHTPADVQERCRLLDRLYETMRERGCVSARRMNAELGRPRTFRQVMEHEILVDIGREGELLFVTGRHRLSLARLLGLDRIPIAMVVRHPQWIDRRKKLLQTADANSDPVHPDLRHALDVQLQNVSW